MYEAIEMANGWMVARKDSTRTMYLYKVYRGEYSWGTDWLYAKYFKTRQAAERHIAVLKTGA